MNKAIIFLLIFFGEQSCCAMMVPPPVLNMPFDEIIAAAYDNDHALLKLLATSYSNVCVMCNEALGKKAAIPVYGISSRDGKKIDLKLQELSEVASDLESTSLNSVKFNVHKDSCYESFIDGLSLASTSHESRIYQLAAGAIISVFGILAFIVFVAEVVVTYES